LRPGFRRGQGECQALASDGSTTPILARSRCSKTRRLEDGWPAPSRRKRGFTEGSAGHAATRTDQMPLRLPPRSRTLPRGTRARVSRCGNRAANPSPAPKRAARTFRSDGPAGPRPAVESAPSRALGDRGRRPSNGFAPQSPQRASSAHRSPRPRSAHDLPTFQLPPSDLGCSAVRRVQLRKRLAPHPVGARRRSAYEKQRAVMPRNCLSRCHSRPSNDFRTVPVALSDVANR
jgi:hypothetical protein